MLAGLELIGLKSSAGFSKESTDLVSDLGCHHLCSERVYIEDVR